MGIFSLFLGKSDPLTSISKAVKRGQWAEALSWREQIDTLTDEQKQEAEALLTIAGNKLGARNLEEAEGCLEVSDFAFASEHLQLAAEQAVDEDLRAQIKVMTNRVKKESNRAKEKPRAAAAEELVDSADLDLQSRLEFIVDSYPDDIADRCRELKGAFLEAFLLAHEGQEQDALKMFSKVPKKYQDDLFFYERGSLNARIGRGREAIQDLEKCLSQNKDYRLALETLINLELSSNRTEKAAARLSALHEDGDRSCFVLARMAVVAARDGDIETAMPLIDEAMAQPGADSETYFVAAGLKEEAGALDEAAFYLEKIPSAANVPLAEFRIRHQRGDKKTVDTFIAAIREEPENPYWKVRLAQAYMQRKKKKDARQVVLGMANSTKLTIEMKTELSELKKILGIS